MVLFFILVTQCFSISFSRGRFITEPSYAAIENLMFGHRAYLGMNPEIEKMTQEEEQVWQTCPSTL